MEFNFVIFYIEIIIIGGNMKILITSVIIGFIIFLYLIKADLKYIRDKDKKPTIKTEYLFTPMKELQR